MTDIRKAEEAGPMPEKVALKAEVDLESMDGKLSDCIDSQDSLSSVGSSLNGEERGNWGGKLDFLLSCLGYAVGLGNVWRFPYLCYRNGGGAFLIPYTIMLLFAGLPLFFMELSFGQYAALGPVSIWKISPIFQGVGYAMVIVTSLVAIYYNMIIAWTLFYLGSSFTSVLPWNSCGNWWNTELCTKIKDAEECYKTYNGSLLNNGTCISSTGEFIHGFVSNITNATAALGKKSPSDEYFHEYVLDITDGLHDLGGVRWELALALLGAWLIVFACLFKGVQSSGKVVYFTATFPYLVLFILLIRGVTLPGAEKGIKFFVTPVFSRLLDARVWGDAAVQIFFSLSPCFGGLITLASYNKFRNNCFKDSLIVAFGNCGTSIFAGFVIFSIVGFMSEELNVPIEKVASQGAGLAFIAYPEAVTRLPVSPLWAILFFCMLLTLGLDSQFTLVETIVTALIDAFPAKLRSRKHFVLLGVAIIGYLLGLFCCSRGGMYFLQLMDTFAGNWSVLVIGLCECFVIGWLYGVDRFMQNIETMIGSKPNLYWKIMWKYFTPALLLFILLFTLIDYKPVTYGEYTFPAWANGIGWVLTLSSIVAIPIVAIIKLCQAEGTLVERLNAIAYPTSEWGAHEREETESDNASEFASKATILTTMTTNGAIYNSVPMKRNNTCMTTVVNESEAVV